LIIDTGASHSVLDTKRAASFGVMPAGADSPYGQTTYLNGQPCRVGVINSLKAGRMDFGNGPIALFDLGSGGHSLIGERLAGFGADGVLGSDIMTRYKAIINCRSQSIFFKVDSSQHAHLSQFLLSDHFTKIPMREEANRAFTVPCSVNGRPSRLLVDTGAFITTFNQASAKTLGISYRGTRASGRFADGVARPISVGKFKHFAIGDFQVPPQNFGVTVLPDFALHHGTSEVDGLLGVELLAFHHQGIIDFEGMNLFLK
jgi:predicted aspartyl protease